jgi:hypothetical protein
MSGPIRIPQKLRAEVKNGHPFHIAHNFHIHLSEYQIGDQNHHCAARRAAFARGCVLVPLPAQLQHERSRFSFAFMCVVPSSHNHTSPVHTIGARPHELMTACAIPIRVSSRKSFLLLSGLVNLIGNAVAKTIGKHRPLVG